MLYMNLNQVIPNIVEAMLPKFTENKGLLITLNLSDKVIDKGGARSSMYLLFERSDNTKVLSYYNFGKVELKKDIFGQKKSFNLLYNHDTGWKDSFSIFKTHWNNIKEYFKTHPADVNSFYTFAIYCPIQYVAFDMFKPIGKKNKPYAYDVLLREVRE